MLDVRDLDLGPLITRRRDNSTTVLRLTTPALRVLQRWTLSVIYGRRPDELIPPDGIPSVYLSRWYLRRSREQGNEYLHKFLRSDDDRAKHDHPWRNVSVLVFGSYNEFTPGGMYRRIEGDIVRRNATDMHRIQLLQDKSGKEIPAYSLFMTGPKTRDWGFHCNHGWVHNKDFETMGCGNG